MGVTMGRLTVVGSADAVQIETGVLPEGATLGLRCPSYHMDIFAFPCKVEPEMYDYGDNVAFSFFSVQRTNLTGITLRFQAHDGYVFAENAQVTTYDGAILCAQVKSTNTGTTIDCKFSYSTVCNDKPNIQIQAYTFKPQEITEPDPDPDPVPNPPPPEPDPEPEPGNFAVLNYTSHCACTSAIPSEVEEGTTLKLVFQANDHFIFDSINSPSAIVGDTEHYYTSDLSEDGKTATLVIPYIQGEVQIISGAVEIKHMVRVAVIGATCNIADYFMVAEGAVLHVEIEPYTDFSFILAPTISESGNKYPFTKTSDSEAYTIDHIVLGDISITAKAIPQTNVDNVYGYINVYVVDRYNMDLLANQMLATYPVSTGTHTESYPLSEYIFSIQAFNLPIEIAKTEPMRIGAWTHKAQGGIPKLYMLNIDCGSIQITPRYLSSLDYGKYTKTTVSLPFCGQYTLDTDRYMGQSVSLRYTVNLVNGDCTATLETGIGLTETYTGKASFQIPINNFTMSQAIEASTQYMHRYKPFIVLETAKPTETALDETPVFGRKCDYIACLGDLKGYTECEEVALVTSEKMLKSDIEKIKNCLEGGVIL